MAKFTSEQAVESITAKFTDKAKGIDLKRTITEAVSNGMEMIGEESEMELDAFVALVEKNVSSALGLARHLKNNATTEMQQQLDDLRRKLEGKDTTPPNPKPDEIKSDDPAMKTILEKLTAMEKKLQEKEKETNIENKRAALKSKMAESIKDNDWIDSYLAEITVTEETDVEAKAKDYVAFYNKTVSTRRQHSTTPRKTGDDVDDNADAKNALERAKALMKQRESVMGGSPVESANV